MIWQFSRSIKATKVTLASTFESWFKGWKPIPWVPNGGTLLTKWQDPMVTDVFLLQNGSLSWPWLQNGTRILFDSHPFEWGASTNSPRIPTQQPPTAPGRRNHCPESPLLFPSGQVFHHIFWVAKPTLEDNVPILRKKCLRSVFPTSGCHDLIISGILDLRRKDCHFVVQICHQKIVLYLLS